MRFAPFAFFVQATLTAAAVLWAVAAFGQGMELRPTWADIVSCNLAKAKAATMGDADGVVELTISAPWDWECYVGNGMYLGEEAKGNLEVDVYDWGTGEFTAVGQTYDGTDGADYQALGVPTLDMAAREATDKWGRKVVRLRWHPVVVGGLVFTVDSGVKPGAGMSVPSGDLVMPAEGTADGSCAVARDAAISTEVDGPVVK